MYSLTEETNTTGCGSERVLKTTVTEEHSYSKGGKKREKKWMGGRSLTYTNGTASPVTYYYITKSAGGRDAAYR